MLQIEIHVTPRCSRSKGALQWPGDFERLDKGMDDGQQEPGFTADVAATSPEDYEKFY